MNLHTHGISLELRPHSKATEEAWIQLRVIVAVPGFGGDFIASLEVADLTAFADQLVRMNEDLGEPREAALSGHEPGLLLSLSSNRLGHIAGQYRFEQDSGLDSASSLTGTFTLDQTYLPDLVKQVRTLKKEVSAVHAI